MKGATLFSLLAPPYNYVSIHAPVKGATIFPKAFREMVGGFNPRTREGCDQRMKTVSKRTISFNPRTREGCDFYGTGVEEEVQEFQSTHP